MGYIKEPSGVDFIIQSEPLTDEERKAISDYIRIYKKNSTAILKGKPKEKLTEIQVSSF